MTFDDPEGALTAHAPAIESHLKTANSIWAARLQGIAELWVRVRPSLDPTGMNCRAHTWSYIETVGGIDIFETGVSTHVRNGYPASSFDPDVEITVDPAYVANQLWFESDPDVRDGTPDPARLDAVSVFLQGLGRSLGFDGWMNGTNGSFPGYSASTFDRLVTFDGTDFAYTGVDSVATYGGPVPITFGNPFHIGNVDPRPGTNLLGDLMNGAGLAPGTKYDVSELDWSMLRDAHVPVRYLCPCDENGDGFVDDADFAMFCDDYDILDCSDPSMPAHCPSDFNHDLTVDDSDYVTFVAMYAALLCP